MTDFINKNINRKKSELLKYYRDRAEELTSEVRQSYSDTEYKERAVATNHGLIEAKDNLLKILKQKAESEKWNATLVLESVLLITYTNYIVMMETRNDVWPYEYMTFSRRIGELWEPFCQLCWGYPIRKDIKFIVPPLFKEVKEKLSKEIDTFINSLKISAKDKKELKRYYDKTWVLVMSGEIRLELDLHFQNKEGKYVVDFKSGFSSNEKGNTNRLLLVASIYKILEEGHKCLLFVRSSEERNNHYLQTLKKSGLWNVYCGKETYEQIKKFTGFDLAGWLNKNVQWEKDFDSKMYAHLKKNNLIQYLEW